MTEGLVSSFPVICRDVRARLAPGPEVDGFLRPRIEASVREPEEERASVRWMGLRGPAAEAQA